MNWYRNRLLKKIEYIKPEIIHLHWIGYDFLRIEDLPDVAKHYPVVWTIHDMWPFCGAEHISYTEERWLNGYTKRNRSPQAHGLDINRMVWRRKMKSWSGSMIHTIGVSSWVDECLRKSRLFGEMPGERIVIHNGVDCNTFHPPDPDLRNTSAQITENRPTKILFMATPPNNAIKGGDLFIDALTHLRHNGGKLEVSTFGGKAMEGLPVRTVKNWGRIDSSAKLAAIYASADLMVTASRMESFGQTAAEALACGTPVVCFDTSGIRDVVDHKKNGYRAKCFDSQDLAAGIEWCIDNPSKYRALQENAREKACMKFHVGEIAEQTIGFYKRIKFSSRNNDKRIQTRDAKLVLR